MNPAGPTTAPGRLLPWSLTPIDALRRWPADRPVNLLHSGRLDATWSRYTLLAEPTAAIRCDETAPGQSRTTWLGDAAHAPAQPWTHDPFADLSLALADPDPLWLGHLGYDLGRFVERLPDPPPDDHGWPLLQLHRCPGWLVYDALHSRWSAHGRWAEPSDPGAPATAPPPLDALPPNDLSFTADKPVSASTQQQHEAAVARAIDYIAAGDIFQTNIAQRFTASFQGAPRGFYAALAETSPAWFGGYIELLGAGREALGARRGIETASPHPSLNQPASHSKPLAPSTQPPAPTHALASISPELFLDARPDGWVTTRPIKGTRPADDDRPDNADQLEASEKDRAELSMIVDLLRNDLGRVCRFGSIDVTQPRTIESHPTVHHAVSTIAGRLAEGRTLIDLLRATLPGGSITGAPKVRAMQIIDELEPVRRGPYCGCLGWFHGGVNGSMKLNIAIRTALIQTDPLHTPGGEQPSGGRVDFSVGGGIVADSQPAAEYRETLDKAAAMMAALQRGQLQSTATTKLRPA